MALTFLEHFFGSESRFLKMLSYATGCLFLVLSVYMMCSLRMTWRKYKLITRRSTVERWDQSYCLFSKLLVQIILTGTPFCITLLICNAMIFFQDYKNGYSDAQNQVLLIYEYLCIACFTYCDLICFVQAYEWMVMKMLVTLEANKSVDQIRHLNFMRDCQTVRSRERCYLTIFYVLIILVMLSSGYDLYRVYTSDSFEILKLYGLIYGGFHVILFIFETSMFFWIYWLLLK